MDFAARAKPQRGFTLIEILLVIAVLMAVGLLEMKREAAAANEAAADAVGGQIALVGAAVEGYMVSNAGALQAGTDPNCVGAGSYCDLSMGALIASGKLPASFANTVRFGGVYKARVRRVAPPTPAQAAVVCARPQSAPVGCPVPYPGGSVPNWQLALQGLVYTSQPWNDGGAQVNWAMLGRAAKRAGPLGGVVQGGAPTGLFGGWSAPGAFGADLVDGQLVYLAGSQVSLWSQFVRRDGSLPMAGNLDMGSYSVMNMRDMFINGPPTNPRNKNLSSMLPQWVFKGVYAVDESTTPPQNFVPAPVCPNGGTPKIKVLMQLMKGTKAAYYQDTGAAPTNDQAVANAQLANNAASHSMNSWAEAVAGGWLVHFRDSYQQNDSNGAATPALGAGLAELYCNYPNQ